MKKPISILLFLLIFVAYAINAQGVNVSPIYPKVLKTKGIDTSAQRPGSAFSTSIEEKSDKTEDKDIDETDKDKDKNETDEETDDEYSKWRNLKSEEELSAFEQFIDGKMPLEVSTSITQFGYDLFRKTPSAFTSVKTAPVGPNYIIGPEDEIRLTIWGKTNGNWEVEVNRDGNISLPEIGIIGVAGLTFREMKSVIHKEISKHYTGFQMNISMGILRTISIYIVGNAASPGAYTVSSLSSLVSALFEAGGPSKTGTMRDIQLKRNGKTVVHFDMYDLLLNGDKTKDLRLQPEDVIFIPSVGPLAGIAGNVKRPAIYELDNETKLLQLIDMAGGLTNTAFTGRVQVQRTEDHKLRTLLESDLLDIENSQEKNFLMTDGDLIKVFSVIESNNTVSLIGAVANEGEYAIVAGKTKIKDVISKAGGVLYYSADHAELTRTSVTQSGPLTELIDINIPKALENDPEHNITMEVSDYLFIRTVPEWNIFQKVSISGEVKFPGEYIIKKNETLSSLIERAGGYTDSSYLRGSIFTRTRVKEIQQQSLAQMADRFERELFASSSVNLSTALSSEEITSKKVEAESKKDFVEALKKIKATGRMTIRLGHLRLLKGSEYDIELEEGDSLYIPRKNSVVNVLGSVMSRGSFVYSNDLGYKDYIGLAGGYTGQADKSNIYVLKVDGTAMKLSSSMFNWNDSNAR